MDLQAFDLCYTQLVKELNLVGFNTFDVQKRIDMQRFSCQMLMVTLEGRANLVSVPPENKVMVIVPLTEGVYFNSRELSMQQAGLANRDTPCLIQNPLNRKLQFIVCEFKATHTLNLLASTSMPVEANQGEVIWQPDSTFDCDRLLQKLMRVSPPLRPQNLKGRSRIPRKNFVRDFVVNICTTLHSQAALKSVCHHYKISERTARDGFKETFGMTPKQFMLLEQLFQYRHRLCIDTDSNVNDIAASLNISTPGRIAKYYYEWFGEKPRQTLARALKEYEKSYGEMNIQMKEMR